MKLTVQIRKAGWRKLPGLAAASRRVARAAHEAAVAEGIAALAGEVTLAFADDDAIAALNALFRGQQKPTNVLSFPDRNGGGDVMLALETVAKEAARQGKTVADHTAHLIVHGILHLMGYDHLKHTEARRMERLEAAVLSGFGIADPYVLRRTEPKP